MNAWARILRWCEENVDETFRAIRPAAGKDLLYEGQRRTGGWAWPDDVIGFFSRCDGLDRSTAGYLLPGFRPLSLLEVIAEWENQVRLSAATDSDARLPDFPDAETFYAQVAADSFARYRDQGIAEAGAPTGRFITAWLPIAEDQSGSTLVVDRRQGSGYGRVITIDKVDADFNARTWTSLTALIEAVANALESGSVAAGSRYRPISRGSELAWVKA